MDDVPFTDVIKEVCAKDPRYEFAAYMFVREALDFTVESLGRASETEDIKRHVSGQELLDGIRTYALREFGPMARSVLASWGITETLDFGEIVFNLVATGKLGRTENDSKEDFRDGFDFTEAFDKPFLPSQDKPQGPADPPAGLNRSS